MTEIYRQINKIMEDLPAIPKERKLEFNGKFQYNFRGVDDIYMALQPLLIKHGVTSVPSATVVHQEKIETTREFNGNVKTTITTRVVLSVQYTFYALDGSNIVACVIGEGMDSGDKAANKAMSAAHKYALLQVFCIPTEEPKDSENEHHEVEKKSSLKPFPTATAQSSKPGAATGQSTQKTQSNLNTATLGDYVITFGKFKDKTIKLIAESEGFAKVANYIKWLENDAKVKNKPMNQAAKDFVEAFDAFMGQAELEESMPKETLEEKMSRLKTQHPGVPGKPMPKAYKDSDDSPPWDPNEEFPA